MSRFGDTNFEGAYGDATSSPRSRNPSTPKGPDFKRGFSDGIKSVVRARAYFDKIKNPSPMSGESDEYIAGFVTAVSIFGPQSISSTNLSEGQAYALDWVLKGMAREDSHSPEPSATRPVRTRPERTIHIPDIPVIHMPEEQVPLDEVYASYLDLALGSKLGEEAARLLKLLRAAFPSDVTLELSKTADTATVLATQQVLMNRTQFMRIVVELTRPKVGYIEGNIRRYAKIHITERGIQALDHYLSHHPEPAAPRPAAPRPIEVSRYLCMYIQDEVARRGGKFWPLTEIREVTGKPVSEIIEALNTLVSEGSIRVASQGSTKGVLPGCPPPEPVIEPSSAFEVDPTYEGYTGSSGVPYFPEGEYEHLSDFPNYDPNYEPNYEPDCEPPVKELDCLAWEDLAAKAEDYGISREEIEEALDEAEELVQDIRGELYGTLSVAFGMQMIGLVEVGTNCELSNAGELDSMLKATTDGFYFVRLDEEDDLN